MYKRIGKARGSSSMLMPYLKDRWQRPAHIYEQICMSNHLYLSQLAIRKPLRRYKKIMLMMNSMTTHLSEPTMSTQSRILKRSNNRKKLYTLKTTSRRITWTSGMTITPAIAILTTVISKSNSIRNRCHANLWAPPKYRKATTICCLIMTARWYLKILGTALVDLRGPWAPILEFVAFLKVMEKCWRRDPSVPPIYSENPRATPANSTVLPLKFLTINIHQRRTRRHQWQNHQRPQ